MKSKKSIKGKVRPLTLPTLVGKPSDVPLDEQVYMLDALQEEFRKRGYVPYTRTRIWQLEQAGQFPARVKLGAEKYSRVGWLRVEVNSWFKERLANRPQNRWRMPSEREEPKLERGAS